VPFSPSLGPLVAVDLTISKPLRSAAFRKVCSQGAAAQVLTAYANCWFNHPDARIDVVCAGQMSPEQYDVLHIPLHSPMILTDEIIKERQIEGQTLDQHVYFER
jgi:hypothetical protein